jgi:hypothetical protein
MLKEKTSQTSWLPHKKSLTEEQNGCQEGTQRDKDDRARGKT